RIVVSKDEGNPLIFGLPVLSNLNIDINFEIKSYSFRDNPAIKFEWRDIAEQDKHDLVSCKGCPNENLWNELTRPIAKNNLEKHCPKGNSKQSHVQENRPGLGNRVSILDSSKEIASALKNDNRVISSCRGKIFELDRPPERNNNG